MTWTLRGPTAAFTDYGVVHTLCSCVIPAGTLQAGSTLASRLTLMFSGSNGVADLAAWVFVNGTDMGRYVILDPGPLWVANLEHGITFPTVGGSVTPCPLWGSLVAGPDTGENAPVHWHQDYLQGGSLDISGDVTWELRVYWTEKGGSVRVRSGYVEHLIPSGELG